MISVTDVKKAFGTVVVLDGITLAVNPGEVVSILGSSGSGKSTLIRCINGLEKLDGGRITVDDFDVSKPKELSEARKRSGTVFQLFNLYPHMTALQNITLAPIEVLKRPRREAEARGARTAGLGGARRPRRRLSGPALGRPAPARRHLPGAGDEAALSAARRNHLRARSGDDLGSAGDPRQARRRGHHHALRHPRDRVRPPDFQPRRLPRKGPAAGRPADRRNSSPPMAGWPSRAWPSSSPRCEKTRLNVAARQCRGLSGLRHHHRHAQGRCAGARRAWSPAWALSSATCACARSASAAGPICWGGWNSTPG